MSSKDLTVKLDLEGYFIIQFEGGGRLPDELSGIYTKRSFAQRDIDSYLKRKNKPKRRYRKGIGAKDAENESTER